MVIRCANGNILNPAKMELFTIIEEDDKFFVSGICHGSRYDIIYTDNRPEAENIISYLYRAFQGGFQRAENIDYIEYLRNRKPRKMFRQSKFMGPTKMITICSRAGRRARRQIFSDKDADG